MRGIIRTVYIHMYLSGRVGRQGAVGEAYSLITRNMAALVPSLVQLLRSCSQTVEPNLLTLAEDTETLRDEEDCDTGEGGEGDEEEV